LPRREKLKSLLNKLILEKNFKEGFRRVLLRARELALDFLFPKICLICKSYGEYLCPTCNDSLKFAEYQLCPYCLRYYSEDGVLCSVCRNKIIDYPIDNFISGSSYKQENIPELIFALKYNFVQDLAKPLGELLAKSYNKTNCPIPDLIIPVPLHPWKERYRGFNQSRLIAESFCEYIAPGLQLPIVDILRRARFTVSQMTLKSKIEREKNVAGAFKINEQTGKKEVAGKTILLIDDISTTGNTILECAKVLKENGAKKVIAAVVARQELDISPAVVANPFLF